MGVEVKMVITTNFCSYVKLEEYTVERVDSGA